MNTVPGSGRLRRARRILTFLFVSLLVVRLIALQAPSVWGQSPTPPPTATPVPTPTPIPPSIFITPSSGPPKSTVTVSGSNFTGSVTITYDGASVGTGNPVGGSWSYPILVPASASGTHTIQAGTAPPASFNVTPRATLSANSGPAGTKVTVSGDGFGASQTVTLLFKDKEVPLGSSDGSGSFSTQFSVPAVPAGSYSVTVGSAPSLTFTVSSSFSVSPDRGPRGPR